MTLAVQTGAMTAFVLVHSFVAFTLIAVVDRLAASAYNASRGALVARAGGDRLALSAGFALGCGLAPDHAQGQYQGLLGIGFFDTGQAPAPVILTTVCLGLGLGLGPTGWLLLGTFLATLGAAGPPLARWAERTRPAPQGASATA